MAELNKTSLLHLDSIRYPSFEAQLSFYKDKYRKNLRFNRPSLFARVRDLMIVTSVHLELSNFCNLKCVMCPLGKGLMERERKFMDFNLVKKIVKENPEIKFYGLSNWGEPLLHPHLLDIVKFLKENKKHIGFTTNAVLLTPEVSTFLLDNNIDYLNFSLDGVNEIYEKIRGYPYDEVKNNILHFLSLKKDMKKSVVNSIYATLFNLNELFINDLKREWEGLLNIHFQPILTYESDFRKGKCKEIYDNHLVVLSNAKVVPCCVDYEGFLEVGDTTLNSLNEIINSDKMKEIKKKGYGSLCRHCSEYESNIVLSRFKNKTLMGIWLFRLKKRFIK